MQTSDIIRQVAYSIGIVVLLNVFLAMFIEAFNFSDDVRVVILGFVGILSLLLGLFVFQKSLSFGLVISGVLSTHFAWGYLNFRPTEMIKFAIAFISLSIVLFALYKLYQTEHNKK